MKLLVLAHVPPPLHGQSVMVQTLVRGLPLCGISLHHVNLQLSRDLDDVGRWRFAKILTTLRCVWSAILGRLVHGCNVLYYVPSPPGKRGALYRDWIVMLFCRPFYRKLVLHWHAAGLGEYLRTEATRFERMMSHLLLGRATLSLVLAQSLRNDGDLLRARTVAVVPNGVVDPGPALPRVPRPTCHVLFLGRCSEDKGLFAAAEAVLAANRTAGMGGSGSEPVFSLTAAGPFDGPAAERGFRELCEKSPGTLRYAGIVSDQAKHALFADCDALCSPTHYRAEALPLVAIESLAHDRPIVATRWRGLPDIVTPEVGRLVPTGDSAALVEALLDIHARPPPTGVCRARFEQHFTLEQHLKKMAAALASLAAPSV